MLPPILTHSKAIYLNNYTLRKSLHWYLGTQSLIMDLLLEKYVDEPYNKWGLA